MLVKQQMVVYLQISIVRYTVTLTLYSIIYTINSTQSETPITQFLAQLHY